MNHSKPDMGSWAIVLAGGEGTRLRPLIRELYGDDRPKQYAPLLGTRSLLGATLDRVGRSFPRHRTVVVTSRWHQTYMTAEFALFPGLHVLVQPLDRGTAAGLMLAVHFIRAHDPEAIVAVFPSDHFFADEASFMGHVQGLTSVARRHSAQIVLIGAPPSGPETGFGWIEPALPLETETTGNVRYVRRFWEKPTLEVARSCFRAGCLWNTFVMVGSVGAFAEAGRRSLPLLHEQLDRLRPSMGEEEQENVVCDAYAVARKADFSRTVLEARTSLLTMSELPDVGSSDLGTPERVLGSLHAAGISPARLVRPGLATEAVPGRVAGIQAI